MQHKRFTAVCVPTAPGSRWGLDRPRGMPFRHSAANAQSECNTKSRKYHLSRAVWYSTVATGQTTDDRKTQRALACRKKASPPTPLLPENTKEHAITIVHRSTFRRSPGSSVGQLRRSPAGTSASHIYNTYVVLTNSYVRYVECLV